MNFSVKSFFAALLLAGLSAGPAHAGSYADTIQTFKQAGRSGSFFFEDKPALDAFESGNFEFGADASAVAVTASAEAGAGTNGTSTEAGLDSSNAGTGGGYVNGVAVFTLRSLRSSKVSAAGEPSVRSGLRGCLRFVPVIMGFGLVNLGLGLIHRFIRLRFDRSFRVIRTLLGALRDCLARFLDRIGRLPVGHGDGRAQREREC